MSFFRRRLTYANVVASLALFIAIGTGGAYAANTIGSSDVIDESLLSQDIKNGEVKATEIGLNQVVGSRIADGTIKTDDIATGGVTSTDIATGSITAAAIGTGAVTSTKLGNNSVGPAKVADNTLTGADINESTLNLGGVLSAASTTGGCTADAHVPTTCASTEITLERPGRILANASSQWSTFHLDDIAGDGADTDDPTLVRGICNLAVDGGQIGGAQSMGEHQQAGVEANHPFSAPGTMALTALSGNLAAGAHTVAIICTEVDGDLDWGAMNLSASRADDDGVAGIARKAPPSGGARDVADRGKRSSSAR
jgi:hypothetical protein